MSLHFSFSKKQKKKAAVFCQGSEAHLSNFINEETKKQKSHSGARNKSRGDHSFNELKGGKKGQLGPLLFGASQGKKRSYYPLMQTPSWPACVSTSCYPPSHLRKSQRTKEAIEVSKESRCWQAIILPLVSQPTGARRRVSARARAPLAEVTAEWGGFFAGLPPLRRPLLYSSRCCPPLSLSLSLHARGCVLLSPHPPPLRFHQGDTIARTAD